MRKLVFIGLCALLPSLPGGARPARHLPAPIVIHGTRPSTTSLREELLEETQPLYLQKQEFDLNFRRGLGSVKFDTAYDPLTRLSTYYDTHLLDELTRTDNPYGHNRPGIGIHF